MTDLDADISAHDESGETDAVQFDVGCDTNDTT